MAGVRKLTEKQEKALEVLDNTPRTAAELGIAAATLTSLSKLGLVYVVAGKPNKYSKTALVDRPAGTTMLRTNDGQEFEFNVYGADKNTFLDIHWSDLKGNPHSGRLLRCRPEDKGCYIRTPEAKGTIFIPLNEIAIITDMSGGSYKRTIFNRGNEYLQLED